MTIFQKPETNLPQYRSKFLRVGEEIHVSKPDDLIKAHGDLADEDDIVVDLFEAYFADPSTVDGGFIKVTTTEPEKAIEVFGSTDLLSMSKGTEARAKTGEVFKQLTPDYEVFSELAFYPSPRERR
jgi:hypothetical protein